MSVFRKYGRYLVILLIPVFLVLIVNSSVNRHNHLVEGYLYSHAHPYQNNGIKGAAPAHSHTALELAILDLLSDFEIIVTAVLVFSLIINRYKEFKIVSSLHYLPLWRIARNSSRAPPVCASV